MTKSEKLATTVAVLSLAAALMQLYIIYRKA